MEVEGESSKSIKASVQSDGTKASAGTSRYAEFSVFLSGSDNIFRSKCGFKMCEL